MNSPENLKHLLNGVIPVTELPKNSRFHKQQALVHMSFKSVKINRRQQTVLQALWPAVRHQFYENNEGVEPTIDYLEKQGKTFSIHKHWFNNVLKYNSKSINNINILRRLFEPLVNQPVELNFLGQYDVWGDQDLTTSIARQERRDSIDLNALIARFSIDEKNPDYLKFEFTSPVLFLVVGPKNVGKTHLLYGSLPVGASMFIDDVNAAFEAGKDVIGPYPIDKFKQMLNQSPNQDIGAFINKKLIPTVKSVNELEYFPFEIDIEKNNIIKHFGDNKGVGRKPVIGISLRFKRKTESCEVEHYHKIKSEINECWIGMLSLGVANSGKEKWIEQCRLEGPGSPFDTNYARWMVNAGKQLKAYLEFSHIMYSKTSDSAKYRPKPAGFNLGGLINKEVVSQKLEYQAIQELVDHTIKIMMPSERNDAHYNEAEENRRLIKRKLQRLIIEDTLRMLEKESEFEVVRLREDYLIYLDVFQSVNNTTTPQLTTDDSLYDLPEPHVRYLFGFLTVHYKTIGYHSYISALYKLSPRAFTFHQQNSKYGLEKIKNDI